MAALSMTRASALSNNGRLRTPVSAASFRYFLWLFLALLGVALLFVPGMTPSFSADDYPHLVKNIHYRGFLPALSVFTELDGREYRPTVRLSLWLNYQMSSTAVPFHYTNLLLHIVCILCLYGILRTLGGASLPAVAGSLVFAVHPIHTTNIFFIMGRTDLLCAVFYLLSVLFFLIYLVHGRRVFIGLGLVAFVFSLLSKEMAASLPLVLFVIATLHGNKPWRASLITASMTTAIFFVLLGAYMAIRIYFWSANADNITGYMNYSAVGIIRNLLQWIAGLSYPFNLYQLRNLLETRPGLVAAAALLYGLAVLAILAFIVGRNVRQLVGNKLLWLGLFWFMLTLMPVLGGLAHRWYLYLPSASIALFVYAFWQVTEKRRLLTLTLFIAGVLGGMEVLRQSNTWHRQSSISEAFLMEVEKKELHKQQSFYFANVPFGYQSTYLFTFHSLEDAMYLRWGTRPKISILSYLNLDNGTVVKSNLKNNTLSVEMAPDRYEFFIFPIAQRRFTRPGETLKVGKATVSLDTLVSSGAVSHYSIETPPNKTPFYYFDGTEISRMR